MSLMPMPEAIRKRACKACLRYRVKDDNLSWCRHEAASKLRDKSTGVMRREGGPCGPEGRYWEPR